MAGDAISMGAGIGSTIGGGIGDLIGYFLSQGDVDQARQIINDSNHQLYSLNPNIDAQEAQAVQAGPSAFNKVNVDPTTRAEQLEAVNQLRGIYSQGGMDPQARADTAQAMQTANQNAAALQGNIRNQMAQRGLSSSGANFAAQRSAAQNAANQGGLMALQAQAAGSQRAMGALQGAAGLAGQVRTQDYGQAADKAKATDLINQFNANLSTNNNQFNAGQRQNAQQSTFNNGFNQAQGKAGNAGAYMGFADRTQRQAHGAGEALGGAAGAIGGAFAMSDERLKQNIVRLKGEPYPGVPFARFEYKHEPGVQYVGVIAQDLEKVAPEHISHDANGMKWVSGAFAPVRVR